MHLTDDTFITILTYGAIVSFWLWLIIGSRKYYGKWYTNLCYRFAGACRYARFTMCAQYEYTGLLFVRRFVIFFFMRGIGPRFERHIDQWTPAEPTPEEQEQLVIEEKEHRQYLWSVLGSVLGLILAS